MSQIEPAFIVGTALQIIDFEMLIKKAGKANNDNIVEQLSSKYNAEEIGALKRLLDKYVINLDQLIIDAEQKNMTFKQVEHEANEFATVVAQSTEPLNVKYDKYLLSPFNYRENDNEYHWQMEA